MRPAFILAALLAACLLGSAGRSAGAAFTLDESQPDFLLLAENGKPVFRYVRGEILAPGVPEDRRRSTYIHPLYALSGAELTDDFPADHHHHRGLSWMWIKVAFDGVVKDLWTLKGVRQTYQGHRSLLADDKAVLLVDNVWTEDSTGRELLDEKVRLTVYPAGPDGRIIDFHLRLQAPGSPVSIGVTGTGYSGLNLRFAPRSETTIVTSGGDVAKDENRQPYTWADLSASYKGQTGFDGVTIFSHPSNPNYPEGWSLRPYGILNPSFTSRAGDYTISRSRPLDLKYRILVHSGKADLEAIRRIAREYK